MHDTTEEYLESILAIEEEGVVPMRARLVERLGLSAAAVSETRGATTALTLLDTLDRAAVAAYQPFWAVRAHLLRQLGRAIEARESYDRAIGLTEDPAIRRFLLDRRG